MGWVNGCARATRAQEADALADQTTGHVWLVGAGPGHPGYITVAGLAALKRAEVVV